MEEGEDISFEELQQVGEEKLAFDSSAYEVNSGACKECGGKLIKVVENRNVLDGMLTFHVIKMRCDQCGKEYLDLDQAEKYDFALILEKAIKQRNLNVLASKIQN